MSQMSLIESLKVLHAVRTDRQIVVPTMGAAREWMTFGSHPLDFIYAPSAMGHAPPLGLGLALAQPERQVIVLNGDGCLLMNLGCLATIAAAAPTNLVVVVFDNGVYEVTGGQQLPGAERQSSASHSPADVTGTYDFAAIARSCGIQQALTFDSVAAWKAALPEVLAAPGPTFVSLRVAPVPGGAVPKSPAPAAQRAIDFARALQSPSATSAAG